MTITSMPAFSQLLIRVLCDTQPNTVAEGIFLFGQTKDNQKSVLAAAQQVLTARRAWRILFVKTGAMSGYPGFEAWQQALHTLGITDSQIEGVTGVQSDYLHTLIEAEALVRFAKERGYTQLYITAPPFHQPRAFMTAVTVALREYPALKLYSWPGVALPWTEEAAHSQGKTQGIRSTLVEGELERIRTYHEKGDLAAVEEVLAYLDQRGS